MPTVDEIRDAITAKIAAIDDVGRVHGFERYADNLGRLAALYRDELLGQLRGWYVRRLSTAETSPAIGRFVTVHRWRIQGVMALDDDQASEVAFDSLIEAIRDAFRTDETLGGLVASTVIGEGRGAVAGVQLEASEPVLFAGVLCHSARMALATRHYQ